MTTKHANLKHNTKKSRQNPLGKRSLRKRSLRKCAGRPNGPSQSPVSCVEILAHRYLAKARWPKGVVCPECGCSHVRDGRQDQNSVYYSCPECGLQFTVRTGTVMERSHVPVTKWLCACQKVLSDPECGNGITATQLALSIDVSVHTAGSMIRRIRSACGKTGSARGLLEPVSDSSVRPESRRMTSRLVGEIGSRSWKCWRGRRHGSSEWRNGKRGGNAMKRVRGTAVDSTATDIMASMAEKILGRGILGDADRREIA